MQGYSYASSYSDVDGNNAIDGIVYEKIYPYVSLDVTVDYMSMMPEDWKGYHEKVMKWINGRGEGKDKIDGVFSCDLRVGKKKLINERINDWEVYVYWKSLIIYIEVTFFIYFL